jgi:hypothetical protein
MIGFYLLVACFVLLIAYGGIEETMKLIHYIDLTIRYAFIKVRLYFMKRKLEKELGFFTRRDNNV